LAVLPTKSLGGTVVDPFANLQAAAGGGDRAQVGDDAYLAVSNASGAPITVTIASAVACNQGFTHNKVESVAAGAKVLIGPLRASQYASSVDGLAAVTYSGVTTLTVGSVFA
jgi:hypothetical protein